MRTSWLALALLVVPTSASAGVDELDLLVYTRTTGFRHDSIPAGIAAVQQIAAERGWVVVATEDPAMFEPTALAEFEVVVFLSTTGDVLDEAQQAALQGWVQAGGGFVGIHSATNTEEDWPWFVGLLGTTFADHPAPQNATIRVVDPTHSATMSLPDPWQRFDEWYNFDSNPSGTVDVLLRLDETTYDGGTMGRDHPIAWAHEYDGGRSFYTGLGHTIESWSEPEFLAHVAGGIEWAATAEPAGADSSTGAGESDGDGSSGPGSGTLGDDGGTSAASADSTGLVDEPPPGEGDDDGGTSSGGASETQGDGGCACATAPVSRAPWLALVLVLFARRRSGARAMAPKHRVKRAFAAMLSIAFGCAPAGSTSDAGHDGTDSSHGSADSNADHADSSADGHASGTDDGADSGTDSDSGNTDGADSGTDDTSSVPDGEYPCRAEGDGTTTAVFINRCASAVEVRGSDIEAASVAAGAFVCRELGTDVEELPAKRYWGFIGDDPGAEHHTLAEFTFNTDFNDFDWYNISHVDAHNLTMQIAPLDRPDCDMLTCADTALLTDCPEVGRWTDDQGALISCFSPERDNPQSPVALHFEACDEGYAWSGDDQQGEDPSPVRACAGEDWAIVFCP